MKILNYSIIYYIRAIFNILNQQKEVIIMYSPTYGKISDEKMIELIGGDFIEKSPDSSYNISVGTDSQNFKCTKL